MRKGRWNIWYCVEGEEELGEERLAWEGGSEAAGRAGAWLTRQTNKLFHNITNRMW